ncbi:MAG: hypothetical protein Q9175_006711, partial [Cornicularia normoerica]
MPRLVAELVRRVVGKWRDSKGKDGRMEWETAGDEGSGMGWDRDVYGGLGTDWDSHTNSAWNTPIEQETTPAWDSHAEPLPEDAEVVRETNNRDSGYTSFEDRPSKTLRKCPPLSDPNSAMKYLRLPFKTKHYFLTYTQRILEATCLKYARRNLRGYLEDPEWKRKNLLFTSKEYPDDRLVFRDWLAEDEIELESWMYMFADRVPMPKSKRIFESVIDLRNAAVHRGDRADLTFEELDYAMAFPGLLGDEKGKSEITHAFRYVMDDPTLDQDAKASVELAMFTPQPCTSHYKLLARIQTLLEDTCFDNAVRKFPDVLRANSWDVSEKIELQNWYGIFQKNGIQHDGSANEIFPGMDTRALSDLLWDARFNIRIIVAHRLLLSDEKLVTQVHRAINIAVLQDDWQRAIEIEILAE